jgi:hypothetical protein
MALVSNANPLSVRSQPVTPLRPRAGLDLPALPGLGHKDASPFAPH